MIKCGVAQTDITPYLGSDIPGQTYNRISSGVKDPLYAKAVVFDDGNKRIASVVLDAIIIGTETVQNIREKASKLCGIDPAAIMVSATHTHTGGPVGDLYKSKKDPAYLEFLSQRAAHAVFMAAQNLRNVKIGAAYGYDDTIGFNRRYRMKDGTFRTNPPVMSPDLDRPLGPTDPQVAVVRIDDENDRPLAVLSSYACHLDVVGGTEYSADYPGAIARTVSKVLGDSVISIFYTGTCGNINHINFEQKKGIPSSKGRPYSDYMGRVLAYEIIKTREKIITSDQACVNYASTTLRLDTRKPDPEAVKKAYEVLKNDPEGKRFIELELVRYYENPKEYLDAELQVLSVGDWAIAGFPGEIFVEFGLEVKKHSPFKVTVAAELTNGSFGYIPVREAFEQGGYEPSLTSYTCAGPESGYRMTETLISLLKKL
jgi:neutral ceramidase